MQRIVLHIEQLLLTNDCVIIPEFGGFVLHPSTAVYKSEEHRFCPPSKGVVFNPTLNHYDRLLLDSYIQMYGLTFEEARILLKNDIKKLYNEIDNKGSIYFEKIGFLKRGDDWNLCFEPEQDSKFVGLKPYGLYTFYLPPVVRDEQKEKTQTAQTIIPKTKHKNIVYLPVNRFLIRAVGVSAAAVALFLIISTPLKDVDRAASFSAGFTPTKMIIKNETEEIGELGSIMNDEHSSVLGSNNVSLSEQKQSQITNYEKTEEVGEIGKNEIYVSKDNIVENEIVAETSLTQKAIEATSAKIYYAIIGSFTSEKQANQFMQQINMPELTTIGIVTNEERVRVYADKFDKREDAQNYIFRLRANEKLKDTWLFVGQ